MHRSGWQVETEVEGREHLDRALAEGRGAILWGMSFCGDLIYKIALQRAGVPLILLSAADHGAHYPPTRLGLTVVGPLVQRTETRYLSERVVIPPDQSLGYLRTIRARLESNATVWIAGERAAPRGNVDVRLFGHDLRLATGAATLAHSVGSRLLPVDIVREASFRYRVRIDRPIAPDESDKNGFVAAAVHEFAARVEQRVLEHPSDWMWETHVASRLLAGKRALSGHFAEGR
jgi:KDO2-lipid IV(A) lauroyltransferase